MYFSIIDCGPKKRKVSTALIEDMRHVKDSINQIFSLTKDTKIPLGLKKSLMETFRCSICMSIKTPVIVSRCCKRIVGCEPCINKWYSGPDALQKPCPHCSSARGYTETMVLKGMDDFLNQIAKLQLEDWNEPAATEEALPNL